jgi:hypothetical protein
MSKPYPINIATSRRKVVLMIVGSLAFVAGGIVLLGPAGERSFVDPAVVRIVSIAMIVFFGAALVVAVRKIFDRTPGFVIDEDGIIDNAGAVPAGRVRWEEISAIDVVSIAAQRFIAVRVHDPARLLAQGSPLHQRISRANQEQWRTPVLISANTLGIDLDTLAAMLQAELPGRTRR